MNEMAALWIELIGLFAGILGVIAWIPQIKEVWVLKRHEGISIPTFVLVATALVAWLLYGILVESPSIILANLAALSCISSIIVGVLRLRHLQT